jgi:hypothetical protein
MSTFLKRWEYPESLQQPRDQVYALVVNALDIALLFVDNNELDGNYDVSATIASVHEGTKDNTDYNRHHQYQKAAIRVTKSTVTVSLSLPS